MSIEAIGSLTAITPLREMASSAPEPASFLDFLNAEIGRAETKMGNAESELRALAVGETDNLHQVMLSISKAQTAFELVVEIRNRILESYQEVMRTQL